MPPTSIVNDDHTKALQGKSVLEIIGSLFESKLKGLITENIKLREEINIATCRIEELEASSKKSDIIITGLPISHIAEAASFIGASEASSFEHSSETEKLVLHLLIEKLKVELTSHDISDVHRLGKGKPGKVHLR